METNDKTFEEWFKKRFKNDDRLYKRSYYYADLKDCWDNAHSKGQRAIHEAKEVFYKQGFEAGKKAGTTIQPIMVVESKDIATEAFKSMPKETYEAYIATLLAKQENPPQP